MKFVFGIFDKVAGTYGLPMFAPNAQVMVRGIRDELGRVDRNNVMGNHPQDFCLHEFGTWDEESGKFDVLAIPRLVVELEVLAEAPVVVPPGGHDHQVGMP